MLAVHFDPAQGTPYWLKREKELGISVLRQVRSVADLKVFGPMPERDLADTPLEQFIPAALLRTKKRLIVCETAGTAGNPKVTAYLDSEFRYAFPEFFAYVARERRFPIGVNWAFIGPSGPHIIFKSAQTMARALSSMEPFAVDFDPRWIKKMEPGSAGFERYKRHVLEQALRIFHTQEVGVLFTTPPLALDLAHTLPAPTRQRVRGIHLGGLPLSPADYQAIQANFPNAVVIPGYGNTLFGLTLELTPSRDGSICYFPPGPRLVLKVVPQQDDAAPGDRIGREVPVGDRGQVMFHRLDKCCFIPNMLERDEAQRVRMPEPWKALGLCSDGVKDPGPSLKNGVPIREGLY
ncbi:MAG: hypothetical protein A3K18_06470 [Lentisphaerae bacterium RIFOXYA12_64_32]|nr:MAG: hypothetical protein A3K18_06470 [Lentisphaerae bacterium RIFOXYA12_64_32]